MYTDETKQKLYIHKVFTIPRSKHQRHLSECAYFNMAQE